MKKALICITILALNLVLFSGISFAQLTPADAIADVVANSGVFPVGTTVVSVTVDGASVVVDLSAEALPPGFGDTQSDAMVGVIMDALTSFEELTAIEVTVADKPLWQYLIREDASTAPAGSIGTLSLDGSYGTLSAQNPLLPPSVGSMSGELAGKLVVLGPSHGSYAGTTNWYRAMRTLCGPNPQTNRPPGLGNYQPSDYYYWTKGFQFPQFYEDDMSLEFMRFLYAYCNAAGAATHVHRNLDKTSGAYPAQAYGYPAASFALPKWQVAAKYHLQDLGYVPASVWNTTHVSTQNDKDIRARPYFANWLMEQGGYDWNDCVYIAHHSNAAGVGQARGTEAFWYTSVYPHLKTRATAFTGSVLNGAINAIRNYYDGFWGNAMYPKVTPNPPEFPASSGTYRGYDHAAAATPSSTAGWQNRGVKTGNYGEIREAKMPATLVEIAFHDDWKFYPDMVFMNDQIWRAAVAWGEYEGICQHFGVPVRPRMAASVDSVSFPTLVGPNQAVTGTITMKNEGMAWCWGDKWENMIYFPYTVWKLAAAGDDQFGASGTKIAIANDGIYYPGDTAAFDVSLTSPAESGVYATAWQMVKDDARGGAFGETATAEIRVDATGPVITVSSPTAGDYLHTGKLNIAFGAQDDYSTVASLSATLDGNAVNSDDTLSLLGTSLGTHTLVVAAKDGFGNESSTSVSFQVIATIESLNGAVNELYAGGQIDSEGIQTSLQAKLAKYEKDTGDVIDAKNYLKNFINEVSAQSGKHMTVEAANLLLADAQYVIAQISAQ